MKFIETQSHYNAVKDALKNAFSGKTFSGMTHNEKEAHTGPWWFLPLLPLICAITMVMGAGVLAFFVVKLSLTLVFSPIIAVLFGKDTLGNILGTCLDHIVGKTFSLVMMTPLLAIELTVAPVTSLIRTIVEAVKPSSDDKPDADGSGSEYTAEQHVDVSWLERDEPPSDPERAELWRHHNYETRFKRGELDRELADAKMKTGGDILGGGKSASSGSNPYGTFSLRSPAPEQPSDEGSPVAGAYDASGQTVYSTKG